MYIVEFLQDNAIQIACVLENQNGRLRVILPNRREMSLQENRVLPWEGPKLQALDSKDEIVKTLNVHLEKRKQIAAEVESLDVWEMTQGEVQKAEILWLCELIYSSPDQDTLAAFARALLQDKSHFRFAPPYFEIYPAAVVEMKKEAEALQKKRERYVDGGMAWFKVLYDCMQNKKPLPPCPLDEEVSARLQKLLMMRIADKDFEDKEDEMLWRDCIKAVPEDAFNPLLLAISWKIVPQHYNYWLDRADYEATDDWHLPYKDEVNRLIEKAKSDESILEDLPFISVDGESTKDIDDAFYIERKESSWEISLALACPAAFWEFNTLFDKAINQRATSIYLPENTYHMLPESLGVECYSLLEETLLPSFVLKISVDFEGNVLSCKPLRRKVKIEENLTYTLVESVLNCEQESQYREILNEAYACTSKLLEKRIENNAIIIDRPDPQINVEFREDLPPYYENVLVTLENQEEKPKAQQLVSELMILANSAIAKWAHEHDLPLIYRTQDIALPKEYAGIWSRPEEIARIARALAPATFDLNPRPHAGMGLTMYAPITSPLRRYVDLMNEAQVLHFIEHGIALFSKERLKEILLIHSANLELVSQNQRLRPRYWKLLYFKQQSKKALDEGNDYIWRATITEEYDHFVSVALPKEQIFLRAKRSMFPDKIQLGEEVMLRLGKIHPLRNEIQILGVEEIYE